MVEKNYTWFQESGHSEKENSLKKKMLGKACVAEECENSDILEV